MKSLPCYSKNISMPVWVTISEAAGLINKKFGTNITSGDVWRYAFYGYLTLSIYFQSPITIQRIKYERNKLFLMKENNDLVSKLCSLSNDCLLNGSHWRLKTESGIICPRNHIMDTPLLGCECLVAQKFLARSLGFPLPDKGRFNTYCGVLVKDKTHIFQMLEYTTLGQRISQKLKCIPENKVSYYRDEIDMNSLIMKEVGYFPVYEFPRDAYFVVKRDNLEKFTDTFLPIASKPSSQISTPLSRLLWLACKHNDITGSLINHPYKLISIFEEWARSDGITDRLSGDTLKKALKRGGAILISHRYCNQNP